MFWSSTNNSSRTLQQYQRLSLTHDQIDPTQADTSEAKYEGNQGVTSCNTLTALMLIIQIPLFAIVRVTGNAKHRDDQNS